VLSIEDPKRSAAAERWVLIGLCPRSHASGDSNPQLNISKAGDPRLRRLLLQGAQRLLGPFGADAICGGTACTSPLAVARPRRSEPPRLSPASSRFFCTTCG
jgi:hypothetical protein